MEINPGNLNALALKGWIYLSAQKEDLQQKALGYFEAVLNEEEGGNHKHLSAMLGQAKVYEKQKKYDLCIEIISEITVCFPNFVQAVIDKAKIHIYNVEWDQAIECITNVIAQDRNNVEAQRIYTFILLARENDDEFVLSKLDELI